MAKEVFRSLATGVDTRQQPERSRHRPVTRPVKLFNDNSEYSIGSAPTYLLWPFPLAMPLLLAPAETTPPFEAAALPEPVKMSLFRLRP